LPDLVFVVHRLINIVSNTWAHPQSS
jgi:hypothetical protein